MTKKQLEAEIKNRRKANKALTIEQIDYIRENIDPRYEDQCCGACQFNIDNYLGLIKRLKS